MAFDATGLRSYGTNNDVYLYVTNADALATVAGAGYFDSYVQRFKVGDLIVVSATDGWALYVVSAVDTVAGTVTITAL